jgi:enoyl-CoA hydratase/carnithine racemase
MSRPVGASVRYELDGSVATLTLDRPERIDAIVPALGTQLVGTLLDGAARHTPEGLAFTRAAMEDVRAAVAARDAPFGDYGQERR